MSDEKQRGLDPVVRCGVGINFTIWERYETRLEKLRRECPHVPLGGKEGRNSPRAKEHKARDAWGCLWHFPGMGLDGQVVEHPLDSWDKLDAWRPPSPEPLIQAIRRDAEARKADGRPLAAAGLEHGFLFLRLSYLRGFENFMMDVADQDPRLFELRDTVTDYWRRIVQAHFELGATHLAGGDDLGLQERLPISPAAWRELVKPGFRRIFSVAREREGSVKFHTDGYIVDVIPDLIEVGVTDLNPQDLVNGLDNLARLAKGRVHISLDIDRQKITVFGTPAEVDAHIRVCIETLGSPQGGLSLVWGVYPGTPVENIEAGVRAMEKYRDLWCR
ncbi:MAG: hypothetical protein GXP31_15695 [Kiritimatiellaeota bacterium]|nr:hypothetical protein [Kiritimatiellota bacterium]